MPPLGSLDDFTDFNDIPFTRFGVAYRFLEYNAAGDIKKVIINNMALGFRVQEYFEQWKKSLRA
jgi:hypothetical protein